MDRISPAWPASGSISIVHLSKVTRGVTVSLHGGRLPLILGFRDRWLRDFYLEDKTSKKIPPEVEGRLFRKLQLIDDATCDLDLRSPPSNHFEKLRGNLAGKHSIRVNKQWRLVFIWSGERGEAQDIYLDNHDYR
jgi:proteic killer suppression protein